VAGVPGVDDAALLDTLEQWLAPRLSGVDRLAEVDLEGAILDRLDRPARRALDASCPMRLETPAGTSHAIDYAAEGGPEAEVRVQALFGLDRHPMVAGVPLVLALTSPGGRVIQKTRDLPAFWAGSWRDVHREMKGRYPRHAWPDDPATARPTVRTKAADARLISPGRRG
jgi:ATP-dependent helicase HrpB